MAFNKKEGNQDKTLAVQIDFEWSIYTNKNSLPEQQKAAKDFLIYAFDLRIEEIYDIDRTLNSLMKEREQYKGVNPEYIPGKTPNHLNLEQEKLNAIATFASQNDSEKNSEFINVNPHSKKTDQNRIAAGTIRYLSLEERNNHRVLCHAGLFKMNGRIFDTQSFKSHGKAGFAAYTLNANGELSIFSHDAGSFSGLVHSSMNSGAPVVCAGELKIVDGELLAINTHSGHYMPTLYNVYRMLQYLSSQDIDLSKADVITISDPSSLLPYDSARFDYISSPKEQEKANYYKILARDIYKIDTTKMETYVESVEKKLETFKSEKNSILSLIDDIFDPELMKQRDNLAQNFLNCMRQFKIDVKSIKTDFQLKAKIMQLEKIISNYERLDNLLSKVHDKEKKTGQLSENVSNFKKRLEDLKNPEKSSIQEDESIQRKMRFIS